MDTDAVARRIEINGIVQGVGFRPFVFQLAGEHHLFGCVANTALGVSLHLEGPLRQINAFIEDLTRRKPPLAHIVEIQQQDQTLKGYTDFRITPSRNGTSRATLISPDVSICQDCLNELFDPRDRRCGYPFINCTNCGPRYTIIEDIPYDRPKTSMRHFNMCVLCQAEYDDPNNRRFHAQPNACAACGPQVALFNNQRRQVKSDHPIHDAAELIRSGAILAVKGLGGFHLVADATNDAAVERLRRRKVREEKPLAVMAANVETIAAFAHLGPAQTESLTSIQRPIVLLPKRLPEKLAFSVAPRNHYYGVMLPYTPLHYLLLAKGFTALVMTSGNLSEEPIAIDNEEAFRRLAAIADYFLIHNRDIYLRSDDSIVRYAAGAPRLIRRSRGYVPIPVFLKEAIPQVLACGAELKNTICLTRGKQAFVSQHIGDLENEATEQFFQLTVDHLQRILDITPEALACDLHPGYLSTQWAQAHQGQPLIKVQHHHAHVAACMAEHKLDGAVIGLTFDGTGFGSDNTIWGGEVLLADTAGFKRAACLDPVPMPGSTAAIKEPWRMGLAYLQHAFGDSLWELDLPFLKQLDRNKAEIVLQMASQHINAPLTSSLGRLFDGVAAILGLRRKVAFEGQAAMELEMIADGREQGGYEMPWQEGPCKRIDHASVIKAVVEDIQTGQPAFIISRKFHDTLIRMAVSLCRQLQCETGFDRVVLSGGCFQNALLLEGVILALGQAGFNVYAHRLVPANDGGISLGQAVVAAAALTGRKSEVTLK